LTAIALLFAVIVMRLTRYTPIVRDRLLAVAIFAFFTVFFWAAFEQAAGTLPIFAQDYTQRALTGGSATFFKAVDLLVTVVPLLIITWVLIRLFKNTFSRISLSNMILGFSFLIVWGIVGFKLYSEFSQSGTEVPATWFAILNSLFIIMFAPLFSRWWESKYNPSAAMKYGIGLILLGLGFAFIAYGAMDIPSGAKTASVGMIFLIMAYLFHTMGELCISPVGLSYLSKLVPPRMIGFMFGVWYLAIAVGQKAAGTMGGMIDKISEQYSLSTFFLIFTLIPVVVGLISIVLNPLLKKLMHGVR